jgi:hypothetical protein
MKLEKRRGFEIFEPPKDAINLALKRCSKFIEAATLLKGLDQDFIDSLMVSCYLQGIADCAQLTKRKEGSYEEER